MPRDVRVGRTRDQGAHSIALVVGLLLLPASAAEAQCELYEFTAPTPGAGDSFGWSLDIDGVILVVGGRYSAATYVRESFLTALDPTDDQWLLQQEFKTTQVFDDFGRSVSIDGDHLCIGAPFHGGVFGGGDGAAYFFRRNRSETGAQLDAWLSTTTVFPSIASGVPAYFGLAVRLSDNLAAVGSPAGGFSPELPKHGLVYIYRLGPGSTPDPADDTWLQQAVLAPAGGASGDWFGSSIEFAGTDLLIGAANPLGASAVYYFRHEDANTPADPSDDSWLEQQRIAPPANPAVSSFGIALSVHDQHVLIGSHGAAFDFALSDASSPGDPEDDAWLHAATLLPDEIEPLAQFGHSISLDGSTALVGAPQAGDGAVGAAYEFQRSAETGTWTQVAKLTQANADYGQKLGTGVLVAHDHVLVGESGNFPFAPAADSAFGGVTVFARVIDPWLFIDVASDGPDGPVCLLGTGTLEPGAPFGVLVRHGPRTATAYLVVGVSAIDQPFKGGVLVPAPGRLVMAMTDSLGSATLTGLWPAGVPTGMQFYVQAWVADDSAPFGFASSNALRANVR